VQSDVTGMRRWRRLDQLPDSWEGEPSPSTCVSRPGRERFDHACDPRVQQPCAPYVRRCRVPAAPDGGVLGIATKGHRPSRRYSDVIAQKAGRVQSFRGFREWTATSPGRRRRGRGRRRRGGDDAATAGCSRRGSAALRASPFTPGRSPGARRVPIPRRLGALLRAAAGRCDLTGATADGPAQRDLVTPQSVRLTRRSGSQSVTELDRRSSNREIKASNFDGVAGIGPRT
jgi:hypothetical protein